MENSNQKYAYDIKGWNGKEWNFLGTIYLSAYDSLETKKQTIKDLKKKYGDNYSFNISNFFNVYV